MMTTASTLQIKEPTPQTQHVKVALIDLYNGEANLGISAIENIVKTWGQRKKDVTVELHRFETRKTGAIPGLTYDVYISSGGPGSPFDGVGSAWEAIYFNWIDSLEKHNGSGAVQKGDATPKHALFICHSFQMMCRHFEVAEVTKRKSQSFGIFKAHQTEAGHQDPLFEGLQDPFYIADFRDWQVVQPRRTNIEALGATILAFEKKRPHVQLEQAIMGIRISPQFVGVQFHPEADPSGMLQHFQEEQKRAKIISHHGEDKFTQIIERLKDPNYLLHTYRRVIPNFLQNAVTDAGR